jgi:ribose/xylose/arabinose/galactoside ABC-type transport system permease subunit
MGGEGTILGVLIGAAVMQVLRNGLVLTGVSAYWLQAVQGFVIVVAIMIAEIGRIFQWSLSLKIIIGAVLIIVVIVLIVRTRRIS